MHIVIFPNQMDWSVLDHFYIFYLTRFAYALRHFSKSDGLVSPRSSLYFLGYELCLCAQSFFPNQMDWSVLDHFYIFFPMSFAFAHSHFSTSDGLVSPRSSFYFLAYELCLCAQSFFHIRWIGQPVLNHFHIIYPMRFAYALSHFSTSDGLFSPR